MRGKPKPATKMTFRAYNLLGRAVEEGVTQGWRRAHKYSDAPGEDAVFDAIHSAVMYELCEILDLE